jgi:hypothetical protein
MESNVAEKDHGVRILAVVPVELQAQIRRQLDSLGVTIDFVDRATELSHVALSRTSYHVALLPAALPDTGWWSLWGEIILLNPRPEILVYAHTASFQLWSGVLEVAGTTSLSNRSRTKSCKEQCVALRGVSASAVRRRTTLNRYVIVLFRR